MESIWQKTVARPLSKSTALPRKTEVLIIGGGIAGLLCAHFLAEAGVDCLLVEAKELYGGVTKNTTAKITAQHGLLYADLIKIYGVPYAKGYLRAQLDAMEQYRRLFSRFPCHEEEHDSYVYSRKDEERLLREEEALRKLGCPAETVVRTELPFPIKGAVKMPGQWQFHPLEFLYGLADGLPILEHTKVLELTPEQVVTSRGKIQAEKIIVATHFPFLNKHGWYFARLYQHRSYVIALENAGSMQGMYVDEDDKGLSFRSFGNMLLLSGGGHRTGKSGGGWQELRRVAKTYFPQAREVAFWATQDCMSLDRVPYVGPYSHATPNLYVATGFCKWGMTNAMAAADLLCDLVQDKKNPYAPVFSPRRSSLHPQLAVNLAESLLGLITPTVPRCPHLGCALKYNKQEHSWDCPCHGSRFDKDGKLLNNPATGDKKRMP